MTDADPRSLVVSVWLMDGRYHGEPEWPPAPARLFQALLAGCARGSSLTEEHTEALCWLESLGPPLIAAPAAWPGQPVKLWVPNNDLDAKGGDPAATSALRTGKVVRPRLIDPAVPILYAWSLDRPQDERLAVKVCELAAEVYQLGRGIDMAWASGAVQSSAELDRLLDEHSGRLHRPALGPTNGKLVLACPHPGSLASLRVRYAENLHRLQTEGAGRKAVAVFQQPSKPSFASVAYDSPTAQALFDVHPVTDTMVFSATPLARAYSLVEQIRDAVAKKLSDALPDHARQIERAVVGRPVEGVPPLRSGARVRFVPLPSIGHPDVDRGIRRVLVIVPPESALKSEDVFWALSGLRFTTPQGAEAVLTRADDTRMLRQYAAEGRRGARRWQSISAVALPVARRRIDPARRALEPKLAAERVDEERRARHAVLQALRHAGVRTPVAEVHVQREPYAAKGVRAEAFVPGTRFEKERLWHVEITFREAVEGPLVIGDGRFLGLGVMAPVPDGSAVIAFRVKSGLCDNASASAIVAALRRAVLSRYSQRAGARAAVPSFIRGVIDGDATSDDRARVAYVYDADGRRLLVLLPSSKLHRAEVRRLRDSLEGLRELQAGDAGRLVLEPDTIEPALDPLFAPATRWISQVPYAAMRAYRGDPRASLASDVETACRRAGLPRPEVQVVDVTRDPTGRLTGRVRLHFQVAVPGPLVLGRTWATGGGLFSRVGDEVALWDQAR